MRGEPFRRQLRSRRILRLKAQRQRVVDWAARHRYRRLWSQSQVKRHYLETVRCGVVHVEHGPIKNGAGRRTRLRYGPGFRPHLVMCRNTRRWMRELTSMTTFDRFNIKVVAGIGLCGAAIALSPDAAAAPLKTGGYACIQGAAGEVGAPAVAGGPAGAGGPVVAQVCVPPAPAGAPIVGMAGAPAVAPVPAAAPIPAGAPLPVGAPLIALGPVGAPVPGAVLTDLAGGPGGKGAPTGPAPAGGPVPGQPLPPGPPQ